MAGANVQCILHKQWERNPDNKRENDGYIDNLALPFEDFEIFCGNCPNALQIHFFSPSRV
jgi:hypothetical protein